MPRRFRFIALLALLLAATAGLSACGGDDDTSGASADELLKATFGEEAEVRSGDLTAALRLDAKGLASIQGPIELKLNGPFESRGDGKLPELDLTIALSGGGTSFAAGAVTTGEKAWLRLQGTDYEVDDATFEEFRKGYEASAGKEDDESGPSFSALGIDPLKWLRDAKVAGEETVGGAETHRITAGVDVGAFLEDVSTLLGKAGQLGQATQGVPTQLTEQQRKDIEASVKGATLEVWTGKEDTTLRRVRLVVDIAVPEAARERAGGLSSGTLSFDLTIAELNEPQEVSEPEDARPLADLRNLIGGGATGATLAPATPAPAAPAPAAPAPSQGGEAAGSTEYLDCVAAAGSDVAKIQQCADLVGQ
jgi:hypothetical protein